VTVPHPAALASLARFGQPWWLLAAAAAAAPVLLALRARRRGRYVPALNVAIQCLAVLAATIALARPAAPVGPRGRKPVLVLRDVSASCRGQIDSPLLLPEDLPTERFDFAATVAPAANSAGTGRAIDPNETRLAPALRLALARGERLGGVILRTDGRFTDADWRGPAAALGRLKAPVMILAMESPPADVRISELSAGRTPAGGVQLRLTLQSNALARREVTLRRTRPPAAAPLLARRVDLLPGRPAALRATDTPSEAGVAAYRAELTPADAFAENDAAEALVLPVRQRLAVVGERALSSDALAAASGLPVEELASSAAPRAPAGWMSYSAVVLIDAAGTLLAPAARAALAEYVRSGGGLVLLGAGPHASPDDRDDPLNAAAALLANPYQRRPLHVVVVLDASGSMAEAAEPGSGRIKFYQAAEAVLSLRRHLTPADGLSVVTFSDSAREIYDSTAAPIDFAALAERLGRVRPAGPTDVFKAFELIAAKGLAEGRDGLALVVSDLLTKPFRPDRAAALFRQRKLALAIVAIGGGSASRPGGSPLERLPRLLSAPPIIRRGSLAGLAEVFARLLRDARGEAVRRGRFEAAAVRSPFGRPAGPLPETNAYLLCAPQAGAEVLARVAAEGDALLAVRRVGLGRSASIALLAGRGENPSWHGSGELVGLTGAAAKWARRPAGDPRFAGTARREGDALLVRLDAADANGPMNLLELTAQVHAAAPPEAPVQSVRLRQTAPGRYEGRATAGRGPVSLAVRLADGPIVWNAAVPQTAPRELGAVGADWANLRLLADLTGGRIVPTRQIGEVGRELAEQTRTALWPVLLAAAAALMLIDWAAARIRHRSA